MPLRRGDPKLARSSFRFDRGNPTFWLSLTLVTREKTTLLLKCYCIYTTTLSTAPRGQDGQRWWESMQELHHEQPLLPHAHDGPAAPLSFHSCPRGRTMFPVSHIQLSSHWHRISLSLRASCIEIGRPSMVLACLASLACLAIYHDWLTGPAVAKSSTLTNFPCHV